MAFLITNYNKELNVVIVMKLTQTLGIYVWIQLDIMCLYLSGF